MQVIFSKFKFLPDDKKSKYYTPDTQTEVYGYHPKLKQWVEIATFGLYSPIALDKYGIDYDVMNLGCGVERIAMVLNEYNDIREMVYPQLYKKLTLTDRELATMISYNLYPVTDDGINLMKEISNTWMAKHDSKSPCEFEVFNGEFLNHEISLKAIEKEDNTNLLGPAATNEIFVYNGNILGIPQSFINESEDFDDVDADISKLENEFKEGQSNDFIYYAAKRGIPTNISYFDALAAMSAYKIEEAIASNQNEITLRNTIARSLSDINLRLDDVAMRFINNENKLIDIRGPIFSTLEMSVE